MATMNPETGVLTIICGSCKQTNEVQGTSVMAGHWIFGSSADFCDSCGEMYGDEAEIEPLPPKPTDRMGTVLVFKEGIDLEEARRALESIRAVLDTSDEHTPSIHFFDPSMGGPVWYIP